MDDENDDIFEELDVEFELLNSEDCQLITLVCRSSKPLAPEEYALALIGYAERIETISSMAEVSGSTIN